MNRNRLKAGIVISIVVILIIIENISLARRPKTDLSEISRRWRTVELGYCNADNLKPCIVSFSRAEAGMLVNILLPSSFYPDFYLIIGRDREEIRYKCKKIEDLPTSAYCTGEEIFPGEALQFTFVSIENNYILAEGNFAIIGLLLATPGMESTETAPVTETIQPTETAPALDTVSPSGSATALLLELLTPLATAPTPTATEPSYPNPAYPNP